MLGEVPGRFLIPSTEDSLPDNKQKLPRTSTQASHKHLSVQLEHASLRTSKC
nr:hypothetical protein [Tawny frogmouth aviadenovirus A]